MREWWLAEEYQYSGHRAYLGLEPAGIVDVDPVLRHFGAKKSVARKVYLEFVAAGAAGGHQQEFYQAEDDRILGTEDFVDSIIHRIGEVQKAKPANQRTISAEFNAESLVTAVAKVCGVPRDEFCSGRKNQAAIAAKEMLVFTGRELGANSKLISEVTGMSHAAVSRRGDAARVRMRRDEESRQVAGRIMRAYRQRIAKSQA